jgi:hypothetical protein
MRGAVSSFTAAAIVAPVVSHTHTASFTVANILLAPDNGKGVKGWDPSFCYWYTSTVQVWVGKDKVTVGDAIGADLYVKVWGMLDQACPSDTHNAECVSDRTDICFNTVTLDGNGREIESKRMAPARGDISWILTIIKARPVSANFARNGAPSNCANYSLALSLVPWKL